MAATGIENIALGIIEIQAQSRRLQTTKRLVSNAQFQRCGIRSLDIFDQIDAAAVERACLDGHDENCRCQQYSRRNR